jgi:hypothetical protein
VDHRASLVCEEYAQGGYGASDALAPPELLVGAKESAAKPLGPYSFVSDCTRNRFS